MTKEGERLTSRQIDTSDNSDKLLHTEKEEAEKSTKIAIITVKVRK